MLGFLLLANIMYILQRGAINYAYGFRGIGPKLGNPFYEIITDYPQMKRWYGLLVGLVYTIPFALTGFLAGNMADKRNRKVMLGLTIILSSLTFGLSGAVNSFTVFVLMRGLQAAICNDHNLAKVELVSDQVTRFLKQLASIVPTNQEFNSYR